MPELWQTVVVDDRYEVSNLGRVRNAKTGAVLSSYGASVKKYPVVTLGHSDKRYVHVLVAEAFIGPRGDHQVCRHLNDNPLDNRSDNLAWGSQRDNMEDAARNGSIRKGEDLKVSKLKEADVYEIRRLLAEGLTQSAIAKIFGVTQSAICRVNKRNNWKHLP